VGNSFASPLSHICNTACYKIINRRGDKYNVRAASANKK
jgi:hypothetical protein